MAIALGSHGKAQSGSAGAPTSPIAVTVTLNNGETGIVDVTYAGPTVGSVTSITGGGSWAIQQTQTNGIAKIERWTTPAGGAVAATSISIAYAVNGSTAVQALAASYQGVASFGNVATGTGTASNPSIALITQDANNWVVGGFGFGDGTVATPVPTAGTGNLREAAAVSAFGADDSAAALTDNTVASPGSLTNSVTFAASASTKWASLALELRSTGSGVYVGTRRIGSQAGPFDQLGFLKRAQWDYSAPAPTSNVTVLADFGSLTLDGLSPVIDTALNTGLGSLTLGGFIPTIGLTFNTGLGALTLTGLSPVIDSKLNTGLGALTLNGLAAVLDSKLNTGPGALTLSGFGPVLDSKISADFGVLTLGGFVPGVLVGTNIQTDFGTLTLVGLAPVLDSSIATGVGNLTFAGLAPDIQGVVPPVVENPRTSPGGGQGRRRARRIIEAPDLSNVKNLTDLYRALNYPQAPKVVALPVTKTLDDSEMQEIIAVYFALLDAEDWN